MTREVDPFTSQDHSSETESPVTVIARHTVRPGHEQLFEQWMGGIANACKNFDGYLGTEVIRPVAAEANEFVAIFRFDTYAHLELWMESNERAEWISRADEFSDGVPQVQYHSLEFWFSPERNKGRAPTKHVMALVTFFVIWPLVHFIPPLVAAVLGARPLIVEITSVAAIVLLMTYLIMPTVTRLLNPILLPSTKT